MSDYVRPHRWQPTRLHRPWDSPSKNTGVGCHFLLQCVKVKSESKVTQSCLTLHDPMDHSLPGSSIHGILQARVLEWSAIAFSYWCEETSIKICLGVCNFLSSVSQQRFEMGSLLQLPYTSVLFGKQRMVHSQGMRAGWPKGKGPILAPLFIYFISSPWACPV